MEQKEQSLTSVLVQAKLLPRCRNLYAHFVFSNLVKVQSEIQNT